MQPIFKPYNQGQVELNPQRPDDCIGVDDAVRLERGYYCALTVHSLCTCCAINAQKMHNEYTVNAQ